MLRQTICVPYIDQSDFLAIAHVAYEYLTAEQLGYHLDTRYEES